MDPQPPNTTVAVSADPSEPAWQRRAEELAERLGLPLSPPAGAALLLVVTPERLELRQAGPPTLGGPVFVDFAAGHLGRRVATAAHGAALLARAVGLKARAEAAGQWHVADATAGLARDAFLLASVGCRVTAIERSPVLATLVADGLERAGRVGQLADTVARFELIVADARDVLALLRPDAVYLDPMFPERKKSALVKKEMRLCRLLVGDDPDADDLLAAARKAARDRVVVKRPMAAPPLAEDVAFSYRGQTVRYDAYRPTR